ncbi:hypothetical protein AJ78_08910 [Emergomyces pasteurianus Ep9510]|uniref:Uncharacterized protein n=1 Tax=Emergomyces pasteurianus Ep9510 TaxID=1447872 RepID=A0A1J9NYZ2_9EURO|nr:hypothetical protein AJ78_08910 [Emergomyces pasteurianus Ep9510]
MVNLRSGSALDLTREYIPPNRRTQETLDNKIKNKSEFLSTLATVCQRLMKTCKLTSEGSDKEYRHSLYKAEDCKTLA